MDLECGWLGLVWKVDTVAKMRRWLRIRWMFDRFLFCRGFVSLAVLSYEGRVGGGGDEGVREKLQVGLR